MMVSEKTIAARWKRIADADRTGYTKARDAANMLRVVRVAIRLTRQAQSVGNGVYRVEPTLMLALREACDGVSPMLAQIEEDKKEDNAI